MALVGLMIYGCGIVFGIVGASWFIDLIEDSR